MYWLYFRTCTEICFPSVPCLLYLFELLMGITIRLKRNTLIAFFSALFLPHHTDSIPTDLKDPFYIDQYEQEHLKPPVTSLLLSADLYSRAGSLILKSDASKPLLGHEAVIQALAQRGLYIMDQERLVTERDLRKRPLQMVGEICDRFLKCFKSAYKIAAW